MPNMEEFSNQFPVEITRDRTEKLLISKINLDYGYGQMILPKVTRRHCVLARTGGKIRGYNRFKKRIYRLADIPTILQEKTD